MIGGLTVEELLRGVDLAAGAHTASRRAHQLLLWLDSGRPADWSRFTELLADLDDIVDALFLLSGTESACRAITSVLPAGSLEVAQAQDEDLRGQLSPLPDSADDGVILLLIRAATTCWARLALEHARQAWPDQQQRSRYLASMARLAYEHIEDGGVGRRLVDVAQLLRNGRP